MGKRTKAWLVAATFLVVVGCVTFGGAMTMSGWNFMKLSTAKYETNSHEITENYENISVVTNTADVILVPSQNEKSVVSCYEQKNVKHSVAVKDGTLVIRVVDTRKWYEHIGIHFGTPKITVMIPQEDYGVLSIKSDTGDVEIPKDFRFESIDITGSTGNVTNLASTSGAIKIKTGTGNVCVENVSADMLDLSTSTGDVTVSKLTCTGDVKIHVSTGETNLTDTECKNLTSGGSTGDIFLQNVIVGEKLSVERSTGDVKLGSIDATEIFIETDTGDVKGSLLTEKVFIVQTDTGSINVPKTTAGGKCEISTDTGDIIITIA